MATPETQASEAPGSILTGVITVAPLCLLPGVFLSHDVIPKVIATCFGTACLLFLWPHWSRELPALWANRRARWFLFLAIAQIASLVLSTLFSSQPALSFAGTVWRRFGAAEQIATVLIAIAAACVAAATPRWVPSFCRAISITGGLGALYGISQYFGVDPFLDRSLYTIQVFGGIIRPPATMGHAIYFAAWLVPVSLIAASRAFEDQGVWSRIHALAALLGAVAIVLSGTRGAVLALSTGGVVLIVRNRRSDNSAKIGRRLAISTALIALAVTLFALSPIGGNFRHRLFQWHQDLGGPRLLLYRESPALLFDHPLLGTGPETFAVEFRKIESAAMSRAYPDFYHETPHNALLDAATGQGVPGLLILAGLFALGLTAGSPGFQAAIAGIFVSSLFASLTIVESTYLWTLIAIPDVAAVRQSRPSASRSAGLRWIFAPALVTAALLIGVALALAVSDAADKRVADAVAKQDFAAATEAYHDAIGSSYGLPGYELFLSREMAILGRALGSAPAAAKAWALAAEASSLAEQRGEERFSAAFQSSVLAIAAGDLVRSEREARAAEELAPNWYKPHLLLAQILPAMGKTVEGAAEQRLGRQLLPVSPQTEKPANPNE